jgi:serine/threonine protein phosphatase 1
VSASVPEGVRIYAIGDVHGRADLLDQVFQRIDADLARSPTPNPIQVLIGDYIDRGPHSREVVDRVIARGRSHRTICLKGNHEAFAIEFLNRPSVLADWSRSGGIETLMSYGLVTEARAELNEAAKLSAAFNRALPADHRRFLTTLKPYFACGDFFFVHAGVRPGIPLTRQSEADLLWIRDEFLGKKVAYSKIIIHGHTPVEQPDIHPHRINIDTGAYATGNLTCLVLERDAFFFL